MQDITVNRIVNAIALEEALRAVYGGVIVGVSTGHYGVTVHVTDAILPGEVDAIEQAIVNHDSEVLSTTQQAIADNLSAIKAVAQSAVGVALLDTTTAQRFALLACLLWESGAVDRIHGTIRPLHEWINDNP